MEKDGVNLTGLGLVMGAGIGASLGVIYNNIAIFTSIGAALGLIIGAILSNSVKN
ncbi:MAG: hypothetical protein ACP5C3_02510 [Methanomicrobiales archaeon]